MRGGMWISWLPLVQVLLALLEGYCMEVVVSSSSRLPDIYWNASNPIFRIDNTDHIIDVNRGNNKFEYDQVNLICPSYPKNDASGTETDSDSETYIIYNVSKEEYDSCIITNSNARIIAVCDRPHSAGSRYFTITFRSFTPQPGGLEFKPGQDYYFISTSTGSPEGLYNRQGGSCASSHMKLTFKVCCGSDAASQSGSNSTVPSSPSSSPGRHLHHRHHPVNTSISAVSATTVPVTPESRSRFLSALTTTESVRSIPTGQRLKGQSSLLRPSPPTGSSAYHPVSENHRRSPPFNFVAASADATTSQSVTTSASTPFWWRPHYTKLPSSGKHGHEDAISGDGTEPVGSGGERSARKGRAWLLVVAAGIAVGVACLIVCGLGVGRRLFIREKHKPRMETVIRSYPRIHV